MIIQVQCSTTGGSHEKQESNRGAREHAGQPITADGVEILAGLQRDAERGVERVEVGFVAAEQEESGAGALGPALDVHDLCAFGVACWVGRWDEGRAARAHAQRAARGGLLRVGDLGLTLPTELEQLLDAGLARVPAERPNAADVARRLEGLVALWGLGPPDDPS